MQDLTPALFVYLGGILATIALAGCGGTTDHPMSHLRVAQHVSEAIRHRLGVHLELTRFPDSAPPSVRAKLQPNVVMTSPSARHGHGYQIIVWKGTSPGYPGYSRAERDEHGIHWMTVPRELTEDRPSWDGEKFYGPSIEFHWWSQTSRIGDPWSAIDRVLASVGSSAVLK